MINGYCVVNNLNKETAVFDNHLHNEFEINFMLSEGVEVIIEDKKYVSKKGTVFIFPPYTFHKIDSKNKVYSRYLMFFSESAILSACSALQQAIGFLKNSEHVILGMSEDKTEKLLELFDNAEENQKSKDIMADYIKITDIGNILNFIIPQLKKNPIKEALNEKEEEILRILNYINQNYAESLSVEEVAKKFGMSSTTLWHLMKNNLLMSPKEYISKIRIAKATEFLIEGASVTDVAEKVGFNSYSHFIRTFKKHMGISPYKYGRNNNRGDV